MPPRWLKNRRHLSFLLIILVPFIFLINVILPIRFGEVDGFENDANPRLASPAYWAYRIRKEKKQKKKEVRGGSVRVSVGKNRQ